MLGMRRTIETALAATVLGTVLVYTLAPIIVIFLVSLSPGRTQAIDLRNASLRWYGDALESATVQEAFVTSFFIALLVAAISVALGFCSVRLVRTLSPRAALLSM